MLQNDTGIPVEYQHLPKVGKCCPIGEVMAKNELGVAKCTFLDFKNRPNYSPYFSDFNKSGALVPGNKKDKFVAIIGDPCQHKR